MRYNKCPECDYKIFSPWTKFNHRPIKGVTCGKCGVLVKVSWLPHLITHIFYQVVVLVVGFPSYFYLKEILKFPSGFIAQFLLFILVVGFALLPIAILVNYYLVPIKIKKC
jgi:hypothetical protein